MKNAAAPVRTRATVFIAVGVTAFLAALVVDRNSHPDAHEILIAVGVVVTSVSLHELMFHLAGGNPVEKQIIALGSQLERLAATVDVIENARRLGVREMHDCTGNYGSKAKWLAIMQDANDSMDLMGRTLHEWIRAPEFDQIAHRCRVHRTRADDPPP
nr:hypothetical protein [uncultured Rhodopila sp.]